MPVLRAASAPRKIPSSVVPTSASTSDRVGSHPRVSPFVSPPAPPFVTMLPIMNPAQPISIVWASEIIPPYAARKIMLAAAMPDDQRLRENHVDPVGIEDERSEHGEDEPTDTDDALGDSFRIARHENLPNRP